MHIGLYFQSNRNFIGIDSGLLTYLQNILYNLMEMFLSMSDLESKILFRHVYDLL